jgi:hypothetical protein
MRKHQKFIEKYELPYSLVADVGNAVRKRLMFMEKKNLWAVSVMLYTEPLLSWMKKEFSKQSYIQSIQPTTASRFWMPLQTLLPGNENLQHPHRSE